MYDMHKNKGQDNIMSKQLFMGEVWRAKADVSGISWNDWEGVFLSFLSLNKTFILQ